MEFSSTGQVGKCRALKAIPARPCPIENLENLVFIHITGRFLSIDMCKGRGLVIFVKQNYIRPDTSEPNLPAWVPR